MMIFTH